MCAKGTPLIVESFGWDTLVQKRVLCNTGSGKLPCGLDVCFVFRCSVFMFDLATNASRQGPSFRRAAGGERAECWPTGFG